MPQAPELVAPAHLWVPDHVSTAGGEAADLAESVGLTPDPEQRLALDALLAERSDGKWAAFEGVVVAPRQNIKTFLFKVIALGDLWLFGLELVVWTAHEFSTAMEAFRDVKLLVESNAHLSRRVKKIVNENGEEGIELMSGQRLRFKARTKTGGRGLTGDRVILDEAFALQASHMGSLLPTMSAKTVTGNPQIVYGSSAGQLSSSVLRSLRDRGRAGGDQRLVYLEWCAEQGDCATDGCDHHYGADGCLLDDRERWGAANLALGRRISIDFLDTERRALPPEEFAREILGWWDDPPPLGAGWDVFDAARWAACRFPDHEASGSLAYSIDVDTNGAGEEWCSIGCSDGIHHELVTPPSVGPGTGWVLPLVLDRRERFSEIVIDPAGPAGKLIEPLESAGITVVQIKPTEVVQACQQMRDDVRAEVARHIGQAVLDKATEQVVIASVGDGGFKFSRRLSPVDISGLMAVTIARWSARQGPTYSGPLVAVT